MYRIMLIDDEQSARNLIRASVDWESLGMEVVGEAASGIEAINTIDDIKPDLAFVDISMPFMDGIEFTDIATSRYPNLLIIIMTAYDKFEYAQQCVRLPVFDYLLKPIVRDEVFATLKRAVVKLDGLPSRPFADVSDPNDETDIDQIKHYIKEHYSDSKLNLTSVAQLFGFSSSYLSRKFKTETGKNFVEYLTECRMEKAIELARKNQKMFCTSAEVGIPDPSYFGRCFKKYTGITYSDFVSGK